MAGLRPNPHRAMGHTDHPEATCCPRSDVTPIGAAAPVERGCSYALPTWAADSAPASATYACVFEPRDATEPVGLSNPFVG